MAVFVMGAGATRGASFVCTTQKVCLPPLDADLFTQLQRIENQKHQALVAELINDTTDLFGYNFSVTYETVFSTLEQMIRMVETTGEWRDFKAPDLKARLDRLLQGLAGVFEQSLNISRDGRSTLDMEECTWHKKLVEYLKPGDEIISFNYDCLLDHTLRKYGDGKWNPRYGYAFKLGSRGANLTGDEYWAPANRASENNTIRYYKMHGSMHFQIEREVSTGRSEGYQIALKERPYTKQFGKLKFSIIPPESNKRYNVEPFATFWKCAGDAIHKATCVVIIGYSFPPTDLHSSALFRVAVKKAKLRSLVIVNPDKAARYRARDIMKRGLSNRTRIFSFDKLEEFARTDRQMWDL